MAVKSEKLMQADKTAAQMLLFSLRLQLNNSPDSIEVTKVIRNG